MFRVTPEQSRNERRLAEVLVHLRIVLMCYPQNSLLQPLRNLAVNPATMQVKKYCYYYYVLVMMYIWLIQ